MNSYTYSSSGAGASMKRSVTRLRSAFAVLAILFSTVGLFQPKAEAKITTNVYTQGFEDGYGLMMAMGPGFCSEMVLLQMNNN